ncbi:aldo/keto reductase [Marinoscillum furvescens]|uniref:Aryl-alcohol dehydrogenase-like predicted oxidoreductase n=1 Tax=Marinoscillum furvescens DSM 4134 TaxID=1122208 RepID=A0A3D9LIR2_MARFU|nr:aldo/keto reductase [Marinoscillum furvescens]REE05919.1 aryl-alcohol dehydrogenase-like predicted oxidoreductase [Marinoscillum furvescens DSM 4134]
MVLDFGTSGIKVSQIGLGMAALGRPGYINLGHNNDLNNNYDVEAMRQHSHAVLDVAYKSGIRYIDVAQSYGKGEAFLASWLESKGHNDVVVGSKWGYYYTAGWQVKTDVHEIKEHTLDRLNSQWADSKLTLGEDLKIYHIHSATFESGVLENFSVLDRLEELRAEGYIIGLSITATRQSEVLEKAMSIQIGGKPLFGSVQGTFNCLEQSARDALQQAHDNGLGVIIKEGMANGRLSLRNEQAAYMEPLKSIATRHGVGVDAVALAYILHQSFATVVLSGAARADHLVSNLDALQVELSADEVALLDSLAMKSEDYWGERSQMQWI